jgi:hypothetical protein
MKHHPDDRGVFYVPIKNLGKSADPAKVIQIVRGELQARGQETGKEGVGFPHISKFSSGAKRGDGPTKGKSREP